jgi:nitrogen fixation NifU-like protein
MNAVDINSADELRDLYRELILDHARNPRHFGKIEDATHTAEGINPLCGDKLRLFVRLDDEQKISAASFEGSGCAISVASASLLTDLVTGLSADQALDCFAVINARLTSPEAVPSKDIGVNLEKLRALDGVREFPARVKCATLAWHALNSAIQGHSAPVSTE